eukprot:1161541-Pelagomonas_calceolata.AAC.3
MHYHAKVTQDDLTGNQFRQARQAAATLMTTLSTCRTSAHTTALGEEASHPQQRQFTALREEGEHMQQYAGWSTALCGQAPHPQQLWSAAQDAGPQHTQQHCVRRRHTFTAAFVPSTAHWPSAHMTALCVRRRHIFTAALVHTTAETPLPAESPHGSDPAEPAPLRTRRHSQAPPHLHCPPRPPPAAAAAMSPLGSMHAPALRE